MVFDIRGLLRQWPQPQSSGIWRRVVRHPWSATRYGAVGSSKPSVTVYNPSRRHIPQVCELHRCERLWLDTAHYSSFIQPRSGNWFSSPPTAQPCFSSAEALLVPHPSLRSTANAPAVRRLLLFHSAPNVSPQAKNSVAPPTAKPEHRSQQWLGYGPGDPEFATRLVAKHTPTECVPEF
jgi:hypothetical protein